MASREEPTPGEAALVICVHGMWMTGFETTMLRHRLAAAGFSTQQFHYQSVSESPQVVLERLGADVVAQATRRPVHLLGHSLGGLLVLRLLQEQPEVPVARAVLLGSPVNGSRAARAFRDLPGASWLLGDLGHDELVNPPQRRYSGRAGLGVIAGTNSVGLGRFVGTLPEPNDGTVSLEETRLEGATQHCALPVSHLGMLVSEQVAARTIAFLRAGRFD